MLFFCTGLFMVSLVMAALTAIKVQVVHLGPLDVLVPAGTLAFCLTYLATDVISEVWGRGYALCVVLTGVAMRFVMAVLILYAMHLEDIAGFVSAAPSWTAERQAEFVSVFSSGIRTNFAGLVAFLVSALADVLIFHHLRQRDMGRNRLWLRNNLSTMVSQILNSTIFITVAFGGIESWAAIGSLILGQVVVKLFVAAVDTPLVYLLRNIAEGRSLTDMRG
ncbi:MAG: queuosine precursor transporter [Pseudomonadota bacterium]|nr:queuosine precursor transporter [Pseudomonadota bacterium]